MPGLAWQAGRMKPYPSDLCMEAIIEFFQQLYSFDELIRWGGYAILAAIIFTETGLLIGFFLPGDSLLVSAGVLVATTGLLDIWVLVGLLCVAAVLGDTVGYWIGHSTGPRIFTREKSLFFAKDHLLKAQKFYEKYGGKTIVIARFVPIVRTFAPVVAGAAGMDYRKFFLYNFFGGVGWITSMTLGGYFLGNAIPNIEKNIHIVIAVVVIVSLLPPVFEYLKARSEAKSAVRPR